MKLVGLPKWLLSPLPFKNVWQPDMACNNISRVMCMSLQTAMFEVPSHLVSFLSHLFFQARSIFFCKFVLFLMSLASGYLFSSVAFHFRPSLKSPCLFRLSVRSSSHAYQPHLCPSLIIFFLSIRLSLSFSVLLTDGRW